jgi:hypothetical protein
MNHETTSPIKRLDSNSPPSSPPNIIDFYQHIFFQKIILPFLLNPIMKARAKEEEHYFGEIVTEKTRKFFGLPVNPYGNRAWREVKQEKYLVRDEQGRIMSLAEYREKYPNSNQHPVQNIY